MDIRGDQAHVAQVVEHVLGKDEVSGSSPLVSSSPRKVPRVGAAHIEWQSTGEAGVLVKRLHARFERTDAPEEPNQLGSK